MGYLGLTNGAVSIGRSGTSGASASLTVNEFEGTGGVLLRTANSASTTNTFTINQTKSTSFGGELQGLNSAARLQVIKTGSGSLTLTGKIGLITETQVTGGSLFINSTNATFFSEGGTRAIRVNGGTLGGTGTITVTNNDNVVVSATGKLAAGVVGAAGRTTYALTGGTLDLSAATASTNTSWLAYDLGDPTTPGVTYDQIRLSAGGLNIGTGLDFDAFDIQLPPMPRSGSYILFETGETIIGTLGNATGIIADPVRITGELRIDGNNLVLDLVVPSTSTVIVIR